MITWRHKRDDPIRKHRLGQEVWIRLDNQVSAGNLLGTKAAGCVGIGSSILPLTFVLLSLPARPPPGITVWLPFVALVAYFVLLRSASRTFRVRAVPFHPDITTLEHFCDVTDGATLNGTYRSSPILTTRSPLC